MIPLHELAAAILSASAVWLTTRRSPWCFPVGLVSVSQLRSLVEVEGLGDLALTADVMSPPVTVRAEDDLRTVQELLLKSELREIPVVNERGEVLGCIDEADITRAWLRVMSARPRESVAPG